ncbi:MAG: hypothetical protein KDB88_13455 [Flavobacteriales bacterium]|nr:hypothetical protein [Flavobacteriales bacterium]
MKTTRERTFEALALTALLMLFALLLYAAPLAAADRPEQLRIMGWLHVDDRNVEDVVLVVELENDLCLEAIVHPSGRFEFEVPLDAKARLVFIKPGHLQKEITLDTRNAMLTDRAVRINRKVKFDVQLEAQEKRPDRAYERPVGSIAFVNGSGLMKVWYDPHLVAAQGQ